MSEFASWLLGIIKAIFSHLWDFSLDLIGAVFEIVLLAFLALLQSLPLPDFLQSGGLQGLINAVPASVWYFAGNFRLGECFAMFGAAVLFRLARKAATLGQW